MFHKKAALSRLTARTIALPALSALAFAISATPVSAVEYSQSNHLTAKEQKIMGPMCLEVFKRIPPFADLHNPEYGSDLNDADFRTRYIGCSTKIAWLRQGDDVSKFNIK